MTRPVRIGINTGGGDAPGLNAVIAAVTLAARRRGWEVLGIRSGYAGLLDPSLTLPLDGETVRSIVSHGGTIIGTTNRGDPFCMPVAQDDGTVRIVDRSDEIVAGFRKLHLDYLVAVGGDGSMRIAHRLAQKGIPVIGVPKTIDNDLEATLVTFGFDTAVTTATEAIDKLHSTAAAHERVLVVEVMGRHAGWIALHSGVAGSADVILLPEIPFEVDRILGHLAALDAAGKRYAIIVAGEGARPKGGQPLHVAPAEEGAQARLGGIAEWLARQIRERGRRDTRSLVLGHLQRGGSPTAFDRLAALRFGAAAVRCIAAGEQNVLVAYRPPQVITVPLERAIGGIKTVPLDSDTIQTARDLGISFGD
jgi:6-phosphofructokinase 1